MKTDEEINALVHEKVAGKVYYRTEGILLPDSLCAPDYVNDANAVLPLLEKETWGAHNHVDFHYINIAGIRENGVWTRPNAEGTAKTFPRAACIALLKAKGVEA